MKRKYRGILATGATLNEAKSNFKDLVFGKGASMLVDESGDSAFVAQASVADRLFNPFTGDMDVLSRNSLLESVSFVSEASVADDSTQEAFHAHCADGCGSHIIASNESMLQFCPLCTAALSSDNGEADGEHGGDGFGGLASDEGDGSDDSEDENSDDSDQLAQLDAEESTSSSVVRRRSIRPIRRRLSASAAACSEEEDGSENGEDDEVVSSDDGNSASDEDTADVDVSESSEPLVIVAQSASEAVELFREHKSADLVSTSSEHENVDLELYSCSAEGGCGGVVLSEIPLESCPNCKSHLNQPTKSESAAYIAASSADSALDGDASSEDDSADLPEDDPIDGLGNGTDEGEPQETSESGEDDGEDGDEGATDEAADEAEEADVGSDDDDDEMESVSAVVLPGRRAVSTSSEDASSDESEDGPGSDTSLNLTSDDGTPLDDSDDADSAQSEDAEIAVMCDEGDVATDLDVSYSASIGGQPVWTAYIKGRPVAMAHKADCSEDNKAMFDTPRFGQAVIATAKITSVSSALDELKFRPIKFAFSASAAIRSAVERGIAAKMESVSSEQVEFADRFKAALATAAIGINRGFFKDDVSPLKEALCSTMRACGTHAPERLVDRVFAECHDAFIKQIMARAEDILSKPADVQESLSKTILDVGYQPMKSDSSEAESGLSARVGSIGSPIAEASAESQPKPEVSTSAGEGDDWKSMSKSVVSGLGRRR